MSEYRYPMVGSREGGLSIAVGTSKLEWKSWKGLKKRLIDAGFTCTVDDRKMKITIGLGAHSV